MAIIKKLNDDGKAPPTMHDLLQGFSMVQLKQFAEVAPVVVGKIKATQPGVSNVIQLSDATKATIKGMGVSEEDYTKQLEEERKLKEGGA